MNADMMQGLENCNTVMTNLNENMSIANVRETLKEFAKNSEKMGMNAEMMNDQMDNAMGENDEEEGDEVYE